MLNGLEKLFQSGEKFINVPLPMFLYNRLKSKDEMHIFQKSDKTHV